MLLVGCSAFGPRTPSAEARSRHFGCAKSQRSGRWSTAAEHVTRTTFILASRERAEVDMEAQAVAEGTGVPGRPRKCKCTVHWALNAKRRGTFYS